MFFLFLFTVQLLSLTVMFRCSAAKHDTGERHHVCTRRDTRPARWIPRRCFHDNKPKVGAPACSAHPRHNAQSTTSEHSEVPGTSVDHGRSFPTTSYLSVLAIHFIMQCKEH